MNIFYLSECAKEAAQAHCDKHVVKMLLESAQILCTVINTKAGEKLTPYKSTHKNHPCTVWAGKSIANAEWLLDLTNHLNDEYKLRFSHTVDHKSYTMLEKCNMFDLMQWYLPEGNFTTPALAMPDEFKCDDPVESYRNYYRVAKRDLLKYTNVSMPEWLWEV